MTPEAATAVISSTHIALSLSNHWFRHYKSIDFESGPFSPVNVDATFINLVEDVALRMLRMSLRSRISRLKVSVTASRSKSDIIGATIKKWVAIFLASVKNNYRSVYWFSKISNLKSI
jgi:hypothetical protein